MNSKPRRRPITWETAFLALRISAVPTHSFPMLGAMRDGHRAHLLLCTGDKFSIDQVMPLYRLHVSVAQKIKPMSRCLSSPDVSKFEAFAGSASSSSPF